MSRRAMLIASGAAVAVVLAWFMLLWSPQRGSIDRARERADLAEQRADELELRLQRLSDLKAAEAEKRLLLASMHTAVPNEPDLARFMLDANDAATKAGIAFLSISPQAPAAPAPAKGGGTAVPVKGPSAVKMAMNITGSYFQVLDYMDRLTSLSRVVVIDAVNATASETGALSVALQARMFVAPASSSPAPETPAAPADAPAEASAGSPAESPAPAPAPPASDPTASPLPQTGAG